MEKFIKCAVLVEHAPPNNVRSVRVSINALIDVFAIEMMREHGESECEIFLRSGARHFIDESLAAFDFRVAAALMA